MARFSPHGISIGGPWIPDVEDDLTTHDEDDKLQNMTNTQTTNLIIQGELLLKEGKNVMLIGPHGAGKTESVMQLVNAQGLKAKYYSCSTLDPYTDLVGVPVPKKDDDGRDYLKMVRPREVDEAEFIFFDEFNRADPKTLNAIFEIIQFGSINGEKLPNLKACWAAMNPVDEDYQVEEIDPALLDRFDVYIEILPKPSVTYMEQFLPKPVAHALHLWWNEHDRTIKSANAKKDNAKLSYVSPRRLLKIGQMWEISGHNTAMVKKALPYGGSFETNKLVTYLRKASDGTDLETGGIGEAANPDFTYTREAIHRDRAKISKWLEANPSSLETHRAILETLSTGVGGTPLIERFGSVLNAISPSLLEAFCNQFHASKQTHLRTGFANAYNLNRAEVKKWQNLYKVLKVGDKGVLPPNF
jgi:hypothetical protein